MSNARDPTPSSGRSRVTLAVAAVALLALTARLVGLGSRPFHWDEARVGYWTLRAMESGVFEYRPVAGGPFLYLVDQPVFALLGVTDASARLVVALIGGLLPLAALLFRGRLTDDETLVFATILAFSPTFVYYSRFLRGDLPLAAFSLVALGCLVRLVDTGRRRYLYGATLAGALAVTTSGFVVGYVAAWLAAAALLFDHARVYGEDRQTVLDRLTRYTRTLRDWATPLARSFLLAFAVVVFFYAPRGLEGADLWDPLTIPAVLDEALFGSVRKFVGVRVEFRDGHEFLSYVVGYAELLVVLAAPVVVLALVGFVVERYLGKNRPVVAFASYWAGASLLFFPVITELNAPWVVLHSLAPLSILAAVGGGKVVAFGRRAVADRNAARTGIAALLLVAVVVQAGALTASSVYGESDRDNRLAQYGQPAGDLHALHQNASAAMADNSGIDVVYVGDRFFTVSEASNGQPPVPEAWGERLPLPWYFERADAETASIVNASRLDEFESQPPVVVADPQYRSTLDSRLDGYRMTEYELALWNREVVVYTRQ
ncbi:TIGR03663 family protein [Halogranum gelatinilyticum]|uniref:TIGR03663 family protein n=1 Tax=Halogranum gelatinilyticum TaxID=660521 RepID=A0A1G9VJ76_9EURY|nr:flippase activity-associated protein Agl23 [Halogranum gelatinilyticum]SDM72133.1 TIGR03663 family protein [Halogranum gelatinilyticum]